MRKNDAADTALAWWMETLESRHLASLRPAELTRALRALSSIYVERRDAIGRGAALNSVGKRAAFALFYGPLHYLVTREIVLALDAMGPGIDVIVDLGCGTGAAGAAWGLACAEAQGGGHGAPMLLGVDRHPWAVDEARRTYRALGLRGTAHRGDVTRIRIAGRRRAIVLAFTANELTNEDRQRLLPRLIRGVEEHGRLLVVEPIAQPAGTWWAEWSDAVRRAGGREDTWRFEADLPERVRQLDRAAGLDHRVLTARSLYVSGAKSG